MYAVNKSLKVLILNSSVLTLNLFKTCISCTIGLNMHQLSKITINIIKMKLKCLMIRTEYLVKIKISTHFGERSGRAYLHHEQNP